ncbi:hypothetical protein, partial [Enterococcus faecalis]
DGGSQTETPDKIDGGNKTKISFKESDRILQGTKEVNKTNQAVKSSKELPKMGEQGQDLTNALLGVIAVSIASIGLVKSRKPEEEK